MRTVEAYQTSDGKLYISEQTAQAHQEDIIGELLDALLPYDKRGNMTRTDRHGILLQMMNSQTLKQDVQKLSDALNHA